MRRLISEIRENLGGQVTLYGWVHRIRHLGRISFVLLRDCSGMVQLVLEAKPEFTLESVLHVRGGVQQNQKAPGGIEVQVEELEVISLAAPDLPLAVNQALETVALDTILDHRTVSLRHPKILSVFRLQSDILKHYSSYMRSEGFTEIKTSKLIGTGTEGGTGLFPVSYFDRKVFLAQSPQFYKQAMVASGLEKVFEIGNAYRAEKHDTPRHLNEYVSLDVEAAFIDNEHDLMDLETRILKSVFAGIRADDADILATWKAAVPDPEQFDGVPRLTYDEAREIVARREDKRVFDITPEGERVLCEWAQETSGIDAVFVFAFPRRKRPFYTFPTDGNKTMSFDLLFRGLEITTGGRRIHDYQMLVESIEKFGMSTEELADYLAIFRYGCPPHGGFAIGLERLTQKILGLSNVREASLFPRDRKRIRP